MRSILTFLLMCCVMAVAAERPAPSVPVVPKGAVEISPGTFRYTDKAGKAWLYTKSPFGYSRVAESGQREQTSTRNAPAMDGTSPFGDVKAAASEASVSDQSNVTKVTEQGDTLRFERKSPFGSYKWTRKKTELSRDEREAWERSRKPTDTGSK